MAKRTIRGAMAAVVVMGLWAVGARGATFDEQYAAEVKKNPAGVKFEIALAKKTYRMGEVIGVELAFSSTEKDRWKLDGGMYDRSGRMWADVYVLDPAGGARDPLAGYFEGGIFGGGLRNMPILEEKPHVMRFDLNEWQRVDRPGKYRLYVSSRRLTDQTQKQEQPETLTATSNLVEFEVVAADEKWEREQLAEIAQALDTAEGDELRLAARRLRFLGTAASAQELARRCNGSEQDAQFAFGLFGLRDRPGAIAAMHEQLVAPDHAVTSTYVWMLARLEALTARSAATGPAKPGVPEKSWQELEHEREREQAAAMAKVGAELAAAVGKKVGSARAVTVLTLLGMPGPIAEANREALRAMMPEVLAALPVDRQCEALDNQWDAIRSERMLPVLLGLYQGLAATSESGWHSAAELRDLCLLRAYDVNPEKVRPLLLEALKYPQRKFSSQHMRALLALPDKALPELEQRWMAALEADASLNELEVGSRLAARYGSREILARMKAKYEKAPGRWACAVQTNMLEYFLRVDPAYAKEQLRVCVAAPGGNHSRCWSGVLQEVAWRVWTPELEAVCIEALADDEGEVVQSAAASLAQHASAASKAKIFAALGAEWTPAEDRPEDAQQPKKPREARDNALVRALIHARGWTLSEGELADVERQARTDAGKQLVAQYRESRKGKIGVQLQSWTNGKIQGFILGEDMGTPQDVEAKMLQFPKGTVFTLVGGGPDDKDPAHEALRAWAKEHGVTIDN